PAGGTGLAERLRRAPALRLPPVPGRQRDPGWHARRPGRRGQAGLAELTADLSFTNQHAPRAPCILRSRCRSCLGMGAAADYPRALEKPQNSLGTPRAGFALPDSWSRDSCLALNPSLGFRISTKPNGGATMAEVIRRGAIKLGALALLLAALSPVGAGTADDNRVPDLGDCEELQVPAGHKVAFHAYAEGVQIYRWNGTGWVFLRPEAFLYAGAEEDDPVGIHYAGPTW